MYDRNGTLSHDFLMVSYIEKREMFLNFGVTLISLGLLGLYQNGQFTENLNSCKKLHGKN